MEIEKEVRYSISNEQIEIIKKNTNPYKERTEMLDITCGYAGFESYVKYGFICRVRKKENNITLEVKNYFNKNECLEQSIKLDRVIDGVNYLKLIGMKPYLYLKRNREVRRYKDLKIFIDEFDIIGNYVEIEYQDSNNAKKELEEFIKLVSIQGPKQDMYGGIIKQRIENEREFKEKFDACLNEILSDEITNKIANEENKNS